MKDSTGKVLMIAFGHPDNVLSLTKAISSEIDTELVFVVCGNEYKEGVLNIDLRKLTYGLNTYQNSLNIFPESIKNFLGPNFPVRFLKVYNRKLLKDKLFRNLRTCFLASRILKNEGYKVLHFNGISGFLPYFSVFLKIKRKIWTLHDFVPHSGEENFKSFRFQKFLVHFFHFEYIQHYEYLKKVFIKYYKLPSHLVHYVPSGPLIVFKAFKPHDTGLEPGFVLFFGRISKYKGIEYLIKAFNKISDKEKNIKLVIAGSGKLGFDFKADEYPNIVLLNRYIETEELVDLIQKSLFVVVPYTDATHSAVVATCFAFQKPVIATNVGGLSEVVKAGVTGFLVPPRDSKALANKIQLFLSNKSLLLGMQKNIVELTTSGEYSWNNISKKMWELYFIKR